MSNLKNSWKQTGSGLGNAFKGLGKTIINSGKKGVDKAVDWAGRDDGQPAPQAQPEQPQQYAYQPPQQTVQQPASQAQPVQPQQYAYQPPQQPVQPPVQPQASEQTDKE